MNRKDVFDLADRLVVITGGLGQIGRQFALELIDRGAKVAIFNRTIPDDAIGAVASIDAFAHARAYQESRAYLSLLPDSLGS